MAFKFGLRLAGRDALPQAADDLKIMRGAVGQLGVRRRQGQKEIGPGRVLHGLGHHADDAVGVLVQFDGLAHDSGWRRSAISRRHSSAPPRCRGPAASHFDRRPGPKTHCPEHGEKGGRCVYGPHMSGVAGPGQTHIGVALHGQFFKGAALALQSASSPAPPAGRRRDSSARRPRPRASGPGPPKDEKITASMMLKPACWRRCRWPA